METCKKTLYDITRKDEYIKRFNIIENINDLNNLINTLTKPSITYSGKLWRKENIRNTLLYLFNNSTSSLFVSIRNKKPIIHLLTKERKNDMIDSKQMILPCTIPSWILIKRTGCLLNFELRRQSSTNDIKSFKCKGKDLIDKEWYKYPTYIPIFYYDEYHKFFIYLCKHRDIQDVDFIINFKDQLIVPSNLNINNMISIYSNCSKNGYKDIPIITPDEIVQIFGVYSISRNCENPFKGLRIPAWKYRKPTVVFRGSATGCGNDIKTNMRLNLAYLDGLWANDPLFNKNNNIDGIPYLDAGIISWGTRKLKIIRETNKADYPNIKELMEKYHIKLKQFMSLQEQRGYKYVIYVEGNVLAYRLAYLFSTKSVVFYVKSEYEPWFYNKLRHMENCIMIESDLTNLSEYITWCKKNDNKAYNIAKNGYKLYKEYIGNKEYVMDYMYNKLLHSK